MATIIDQSALPPPPRQIRFVNNQGLPPSKRRRINAACLTCRKRKTRCAGERPTCSTCTKNGHTCQGYNEPPERKKEASRGGQAGDKDLLAERDDDSLEDEDDEEESKVRVEPGHWRSARVSHDQHAGGASPQSRQYHDPSNRSIPNTKRVPDADWKEETPKPRHQVDKAAADFEHNIPVSQTTVDSSAVRPRLQLHGNKVPYFRYFGPTAIVPGYKEMIAHVSYPDRRRSRGDSFSTTFSGSASSSHPASALAGTTAEDGPAVVDDAKDIPVYDISDSGPTHPQITSLMENFFTHLGSSFPFLKRDKFLRLVKERRVEPILVDSVLALAARVSKSKDIRDRVGHFYSQRAKAATVDPFPCPTVGAVQAYLLLAYESFGQDQDSALWAYLQLAIGMAIDIGLPKRDGVKYQGEKDPWYTLTWMGKHTEGDGSEEKQGDDGDTLSPEEQCAVEQERIDTFWAVFVLDRVISSGTGRAVRFKDDDFEIPLPKFSVDPLSGWPNPYPAFLRIIHLYGRVSDLLNNVRNPNELTQEKRDKLVNELTLLHQTLDARLHFNAVNFQEYSRAGHGTTFILLHLWFHTLIIILHQPTVVFGTQQQANNLPNGRELAISSAQTVADILSFAELIDPKSFIGNPFTSQPMYIAACAFLVQSGAHSPGPPSPKGASVDACGGGRPTATGPEAKLNSLLAFGANQKYQQCYKSLQQLQSYWGGVKYIITALDQKSKGIWDCETYTHEEYAMTKIALKRASSSLGRLPRALEIPASPNAPPMVGFSLTGTTNSPSSSLTWMFQNQPSGSTNLSARRQPHPSHASTSHQPSVGLVMANSGSMTSPVPGPNPSTPPGNMIYDPIRQSLPGQPPMFPPAYPQAPVSALRFSSHAPSKPSRRRNRLSVSSTTSSPGVVNTRFPMVDAENVMDTAATAGDTKLQILAGMAQNSSQLGTPTSFSPSAFEIPGASPSETSLLNRTTNHPFQQPPPPQQHSSGQQSVQADAGADYSSPFSQTTGTGLQTNDYYSQPGDLMFDSREITWGYDPAEAMAPWLAEYFSSNDVLGLFQTTPMGEDCGAANDASHVG